METAPICWLLRALAFSACFLGSPPTAFAQQANSQTVGQARAAVAVPDTCEELRSLALEKDFAALCLAVSRAKEGRLDDALKGYEKLLESDSSAVRDHALEGVTSIERRSNSVVEQYVVAPAGLVMGGVLKALAPAILIAVVYGLALAIGRWWTRGRYEVREFEDATENKLAWNIAPIIEEFIQDAQIYYSGHMWENRGSGGSDLVPWRSDRVLSDVTELVTKGASDAAGAITGAISKRVLAPEYSIDGVWRLTDDQCGVDVVMRRRRKIVNRSYYNAPLKDYPDWRRQMAYEIAVAFVNAARPKTESSQ